MMRRFLDRIRQLTYGVRVALRDIWNLLVQPLSGLRPSRLRETVYRNQQDLVASSQMVARTTSTTLLGVLGLIVFAPWHFTHWLIAVPERTRFYLRSRSPVQLVGGGALLLCLAIGIAWPTVTVIRERNMDKLRREQYRQLELNFAQADLQSVKHNLEVLRDKSPNNATIAQRLAAIEKGEAASDDPKLARLLMVHHFGAGRPVEAAREATKLLDHEPHDWTANLILSERALAAGDRKAAAAYVSQMPKPHEPPEPIPVWTSKIANNIFIEVGEEARREELLEFITEKYIPELRNAILPNFEVVHRLQFIELYNLALSRLAKRPDLKAFWVPAQSLCHGIANEPQLAPSVLVNLGVLQEIQLSDYLRELLRMKLVSAEEYKQFADEIEERLAGIWQRLRTAEPTNPISYLGQAMQRARAGDLRGAVDRLDEGIAAAGPGPHLVEKKALIMRQLDPVAGLQFVDSVLADGNLSLPMCRVLAEAALAAERPDRALQAVHKAHAIRQDEPLICRLEAEALLKAGRATDAAAALRRVLPSIARDPIACAVYVRALAASGSISLAQDFLDEALESEQSSISALLAGAGELALHGQLGPAIERLRKLSLRDPQNHAVAIQLGDSLRQHSENVPGGWNREIVFEILRYYQLALQKQPDNLRFANDIAWLQLVALDSPKYAYVTAAPLLAATDLSPEMLETLGAVHWGAGEFEPARVALEKSIKAGHARAGTFALLALTYQGLNRADLAGEHIQKALQMPKANLREGEFVERARSKIAKGGK